MEIDVTAILEEHDLTDYSDSVYNSGLQNIGEITWHNAVEACAAMDAPLCPDQDTLRAWIEDFGAWSKEEIDAMTDVETNALLLQFVAGSSQEFLAAEEDDRTDEYLAADGSLFRGDDGRIYFYVGS